MTAFKTACQVFGKIVCNPYWYWLARWVPHGVLFHAFYCDYVELRRTSTYDAFEMFLLDIYRLGGYYNDTYNYITG